LAPRSNHHPDFCIACPRCRVRWTADDTSPAIPAPPAAKKVPKSTEIHGQKLVDNYYWLRDKKNPEVKAYLEAENAYTDAVMKPTERLQKKLYDEMLSRIKETDVEVPYREGGTSTIRGRRRGSSTRSIAGRKTARARRRKWWWT